MGTPSELNPQTLAGVKKALRVREIFEFLDQRDDQFLLPSAEKIDNGTSLVEELLRYLGNTIYALREQGLLERDMDALVVRAWLNEWADVYGAKE